MAASWLPKVGAAVLVACAVAAVLADQPLTERRTEAWAGPALDEATPAQPPPVGIAPGGPIPAETTTGLGACAELADAGARASASSLPAQSVAQGRTLGEGSSEASIVLVTAPDALGTLANTGDPQQLAAIDLTSDVLVGLFVGRRPRGGYGVTIKHVTPTAAGVCMIARLTAPPPGADAIDVETYPYHVVAVPRSEAPLMPGTRWTAISRDGALIAETVVP